MNISSPTLVVRCSLQHFPSLFHYNYLPCFPCFSHNSASPSEKPTTGNGAAALQQRRLRVLQRPHPPPRRGRARGGHLRRPRRQRLRALTPHAGAAPRRCHHGRLRGRHRGRVLPRDAPPLGLPLPCRTAYHRHALLRRLRARRHKRRRRAGRVRERVQGVPARRLLRLAQAEGGGRTDVGKDQELPRGGRRVPEPAEQPDIRRVHQRQPLAAAG